ncbi:MAG: helix-turn-helix domain-containing protein, partial [Bacillota bacterium]
MKKANKVKSVTKAMTIFSELAKLGKPISLSLLSTKTRMNISTVYRILNTMTELGYVQQNEKDLY